jgi:predicted nucleotidyltransferase
MANDETVLCSILTRLDEIEKSESVKILYACESGSRAWGFASADRDYDVRFLYVRPLDWYLSIDVEKRRDVIERPVDCVLDINGWDIRKALMLLRKSNPPLLEWLGSPIVYRESAPAAAAMRNLAKQYQCATSCAHHYLHMARRNYDAYLRGEEIRLKKYLYALRPLLAVLWLERGYGIVPTEFAVLCERLLDDHNLLLAIGALLEKKRTGKELDRGPRIEPISAFLERELPRMEKDCCHLTQNSPPLSELNQLFRQILADAWPSREMPAGGTAAP